MTMQFSQEEKPVGILMQFVPYTICVKHKPVEVEE